MKLYSSKFDEYIAMSREYTALIASKKKPEDVKDGDDEENLDLTLKKLKIIELEREIINLRSIIASLVVPKLNELDFLIVINSFYPYWLMLHVSIR